MEQVKQKAKRASHARSQTFDWLEPAASFSEIGEAIGVSRQRAEQIYKSAMSKVVRSLNRHDINERTIVELLAAEPVPQPEPDALSTRVHMTR